MQADQDAETLMVFEETGLFLSFVSYPFYKDGREIYTKVFSPFFEEHKKQIDRFDPASDDGSLPYRPAGYRMFGSQGLAILSLVDDFSFHNRFFNKNHIQTLLQNSDVDSDGIDLDFKSVVISGVSERCLTDRTLEQSAVTTFLREDGRYPFIGIIRLKIDYQLLSGSGRGIHTTRCIKGHISGLAGRYEDGELDYIAVDCFDNDEMTVVAFAHQLLSLYNFLGEIRSITTTDLNRQNAGAVRGHTNPREEWHVFRMAYLCYGYDVEQGLPRDIPEQYAIRCHVETKTGHRDVFRRYLADLDKADSEEQRLGLRNIECNISGGCNLSFTMPLKNLPRLESLCRDRSPESVFCRDVRKVKVTLSDVADERRTTSDIDKNSHLHTRETRHEGIEREVFSSAKRLLKQAGVSKMVRERLLALFELYNLSCQNLLQRFYLEELKSAINSFVDKIKDMSESPEENLRSIEAMLNEEITNLENACYDRLHNQKSDQTPLEYSGGIQQYLTSFDFAYKQIYQAFSPKDYSASFLAVTGAERASSERSLFKLNIHDIVFPELFATTVWKEIANFALKTQQCYTDADADGEVLFVMNTWNGFTNSPRSLQILKDAISQSASLLHSDDVSECIKSLISNELIAYFIKDFIVYHFAFCEKYNLLWHFYFKTMLQTTVSYSDLNRVDKKYFIHTLMRLFMVGMLADGRAAESPATFIQQQSRAPFDSILASAWMECYEKVRIACGEIYEVLNRYGFREMVEYNVRSCEANIYSMEHPGEEIVPYNKTTVRQERWHTVEKMLGYFEQGVLLENRTGSKSVCTFVICLLNAYLEAVYHIDGSGSKDRPVRCVPRNASGEVHDIMACKSDAGLRERMTQILVDTTGGFFVPSAEVRKQYFQLRTTLYRSLWHHRFVNQAVESNSHSVAQ